MIPVTWGSLDGEPEAAAGADPKENAEKQPERSYIPEERSGRGHGSKNTGKKIAALVMSGILFGCVAGGTMVGVNALSNRLLPGETAQETIGQVSQETQADAGTKTQTSIGNDVSSIVEKAMPSVVGDQQQDDLYTGQLAVWSAAVRGAEQRFRNHCRTE